MKVTLPIHTVNESNQRSHYMVKAKRTRTARTAAALAVKAALRKEPLRPVLVVTLTRHSPGTPDSDSIPSALKAVRDGVADALRIDDGSSLVEWRYAQDHGEHAVTVEVAPFSILEHLRDNES